MQRLRPHMGNDRCPGTLDLDDHAVQGDVTPAAALPEKASHARGNFEGYTQLFPRTAPLPLGRR